ncbi:MAG TPA: metallophosphoesterase, partial [Candidatus Polarisedimenticolaceae bacterium]|nr:metallophosphoesterase [Candidatus Polarisedimenticolaceae bacterium]
MFSPYSRWLGPRGRRIRTALLLAAAAAVALGLWGFWWEPAHFRTVETVLEPPDWPAALGGLRVAVLGDLHVGSPFHGLDQLERIVAATQRLRPDLVLLCGDYVIHDVIGGRFVAPEPIAERLAGLRARRGVWAVLGNHDAWFDAPRVRLALENAGIPVLEDRAVKLGSGPDGLWLVGVGDFWTARHDVAGALAQVTDGAPVVLFTHNPDVFPDVPARVALTVAAHTHGGQVRLPGFGPPVVPSIYGRRYAAGLVVEDGRALFVTTGLGTSIVPVRWGVPPEITLLVLEAAAPRRARPARGGRA